VGNERFGLDPDVVRACDAAVRVPLFGRKNSLNVVSALAVALFAARRNFQATQWPEKEIKRGRLAGVRF
jgi:tRNA G18 (ribose-2'-O)-methylase SpoU